MVEPKVNEVWRTHSGRLCLIISSNKMLWYDEVDKEYVSSEIYSRLDCRTDLTPQELFKTWIN